VELDFGLPVEKRRAPEQEPNSPVARKQENTGT